MPFTLPPITLTENQTSLVNIPGNLGSVAYIKLVNASPYLLSLTNLLGGSDYMQPGEANVWPVPGLTTAVQVTPQQFALNPNIIPSSVLVVTWYLEGEAPNGSYPVNFNVLSYVGNNIQVTSATNTLEQDLATPFILAGITPSFTAPNIYNTTAGIGYPRQFDGSLLRTAVALYTTVTSTPNATLYHDLNPDGTFSFGTAHSTQANYLTIATITTNASGNITAVTDTRVMSTLLFAGMSQNPGAPGLVAYNVHVQKDLQCDDIIAVQGTSKITSPATGNGYTASIGSNDALYFQPTGSTQNQGAVFYYWVPGPNVALPLFSIAQPVGLAYIDTNGVLHSPAPVTLLAGNQETGVAGYTGYAPGAGNGLNYIFNFKTVMTNVPTSLTSSNLSAPTNANSLGFNLLTKYGANMFWSATAAGISTWAVQYTTVGNCLLALDLIARTLDHHCDTCGQVTRGASFDTVCHLAGATPVEASMSVGCPSCGALEHFNCALSLADEADMSPQGSGAYATTRGAQATLIRQLMTALGLEVLS